MENIPTDVVVRRVKVIILLPWLSLTGMVSLCEVSPFSAVSPLMPLCWSALERGSWMTGWNTVPWKMKKERCGMVKNESQVKLFQNYWNSFLLGPWGNSWLPFSKSFCWKTKRSRCIRGFVSQIKNTPLPPPPKKKFQCQKKNEHQQFQKFKSYLFQKFKSK